MAIMMERALPEVRWSKSEDGLIEIAAKSGVDERFISDLAQIGSVTEIWRKTNVEALFQELARLGITPGTGYLLELTHAEPESDVCSREVIWMSVLTLSPVKWADGVDKTILCMEPQ